MPKNVGKKMAITMSQENIGCLECSYFCLSLKATKDIEFTLSKTEKSSSHFRGYNNFFFSEK